MIYFDVVFNDGHAVVSIRRLSGSIVSRTIPENTYAYEITQYGKRHRGTVTHEGPEDLALISAVFADYGRQHERSAAS